MVFELGHLWQYNTAQIKFPDIGYFLQYNTGKIQFQELIKNL